MPGILFIKCNIQQKPTALQAIGPEWLEWCLSYLNADARPPSPNPG